MRNGLLLAALAVACGALAVAQYAPTRSFGFNYDDYHFVRPYESREVAAAFRGPWDTSGIEVPFYRPLTIALYAARFRLFRFDAAAYHTASVAAFVVIGFIGAVFVMRVAGSIAAGGWFALFWIVHPSFPTSLVAWITNQMHLLEALLVFAALLSWWTVKQRRARWWTMLFVLQIAVFLVKEDGILLLPFLIVCHALYRALVDRTTARVPVTVLVATVGVLAALIAIRHEALGGLGGYGRLPDASTALANLWKGPRRAFFLRPAPTFYQQCETWFVALSLALGTAWALLRDRRAFFLIAAGVVMALTFNLPFFLVAKPEQYHFIGAGSAFALAGAVHALTHRTHAAAAVVVAAATLAAVGMMSSTSRDLADLYAPLSPVTLATDEIVHTWAAVPDEIKAWLDRKRAQRREGDLTVDVPFIVYGAGGREQEASGRSYRWTREHTWLFVNQRADSVDLIVRALMLERPRRPFVTTILVEGRTYATLTLADDAERRVVVPLPRGAPGGRRMHLVEILVDHTWTPGPSDPRRLGIVLDDPVVHPEMPPLGSRSHDAPTPSGRRHKEEGRVLMADASALGLAPLLRDDHRTSVQQTVARPFSLPSTFYLLPCEVGGVRTPCAGAPPRAPESASHTRARQNLNVFNMAVDVRAPVMANY